jgi:hypothetical protein
MWDVMNPKRRDVEFAPGERVWLSSSHLPLKSGQRKLASRWAGPFSVEERLGQQAYRLALPRNWKVHPVFHTSQLKAVAGRPKTEQAVPIDDSGEAEYEVDRILEVRTVHGRTEYLV